MLCTVLNYEGLSDNREPANITTLSGHIHEDLKLLYVLIICDFIRPLPYTFTQGDVVTWAHSEVCLQIKHFVNKH